MSAKETSKDFLGNSWHVLCYLLQRFIEEGFTYRAASLAYATLLAIVPLMIVMITILSFFPIFSGIDTELQQLILDNFVAQSANIISAYLQQFLSHVHRLSTLNVVFLVVIDVLMLYNIKQAFNAAWKSQLNLRLSISLLIYLLALLLAPLLLGGVLVLAGLIYKISYLKNFIGSGALGSVIGLLLPYGITFATFTLFNWALPSRHVAIKHACYGGLITTVIFEIAKAAFAVYFNHASTYHLLYGTMATLPLFLVWLYVSWLIILLGAIITNVIAVGIPNSSQTMHGHLKQKK